MNKKAYYFSVDAFIALVIVLGVVIFIRPPVYHFSPEIRVHDDLLRVLSDLKVSEIDNSYIQSLISEGSITNLNNSVLEQMAEFYANSDPRAGLIAESIFSDLDVDEGLAIYFENSLQANSTVINDSDIQDVRTTREVISGIAGGVNASSGFSSRAFLYSENRIKYFYFGGYVGDGNISFNLGEDVSTASVEADFSGDFDLYINGNYTNSYSPTPGIPYSFDLSAYSNEFSLGTNNISFKSDEDLGIAGGYIRVVYNDSSVNSGEKFLPGIEGLINVYDGVYVPGNLTEMEVFLHYNSSYDIFMSLGDDEIYLDNSSGTDLEVTLDNATLFSILDFSDVSMKTIPLRIGIKNVSQIEGLRRNADVFSVTDLSTSMDPSCVGSGISFGFCCFFSGGCDTESKCLNCGGTYEDKIQLAKEANLAFIEVVLNYSQNRVGLVGYETNVDSYNTHDLSNDSGSLNSLVNAWSTGGSTCMCCGINDAVSKINSQSNENNFRSMVVMSDGEANVECAAQGTTPDLNGNGDSDDAGDDAIQAACDAYNNYGIKVYSVGFGSGADQNTLQDIASCGGGDYHYGDVEELVDIYRQIAEDILNAAYDEQKLIGEGGSTLLYPDSKIAVKYESDIPYGMMITSESDIFGNTISQGDFDIPENSTVYDVRVVSYSSSRWTSLVEVYDNETSSWHTVFNLSDYNPLYASLGDPYFVSIPPSFVGIGNNTIRVKTGINSTNFSGGSEYNKVVYTVIKDVAAYSPVLPVANGCIWHIEFEDGTNDTMNFPSDYSGTDECYFASNDFFFPGDNVLLANPNDAIGSAILNLLYVLDLNGNQKIETKFSESDMGVSSVEIEGLPFTWETEVQVRGFR